MVSARLGVFTFVVMGCLVAACGSAPSPTAVEADPEPVVRVSAWPSSAGTVARIKLRDQERAAALNRKLHFCVFENGAHDLVYVGTKFGMWSRGKFDLTLDGKKVFTGEVPHLVYEGVLLDMGDVLEAPLTTNYGVHVTRVTGIFK